MAAAELAATAELFGELLLSELTSERLSELRRLGVGDALAELGLHLPEASEWEALAADYFGRFLNPKDGYPLVQSLYEEGSYQGEAARGVEQVAEAAGLEFQASAARSAPDHVGAELMLWAQLVTRDPDAAAEFARRHLAWAPRILRRSREIGDGTGSSFYPTLVERAAELIERVLEEAPRSGDEA